MLHTRRVYHPQQPCPGVGFIWYPTAQPIVVVIARFGSEAGYLMPLLCCFYLDCRRGVIGQLLSKPASLFGANPADAGDVDHLFIRTDALPFVIRLRLCGIFWTDFDPFT